MEHSHVDDAAAITIHNTTITNITTPNTTITTATNTTTKHCQTFH